MTVISNQSGCGDYSVTGWLTELITTGKDYREDFHDSLDGVEDVGKDIIGPLRDGAQGLGGGIDDAIEKFGDTELFDPDAIKDAVVGQGEGILADAVNAGIDTLPTTIGESGAKNILTGAESGGDVIERVAGDMTDAFAKKAAEGLEEAVDEALPADWDFELGLAWRDWTKIALKAVMKYQWVVCPPVDIDIGGEGFVLNPLVLYLEAGASFEWHDGWNYEANLGGVTELIHPGSGYKVYAGAQASADGSTDFIGGFSKDF